MSGRSCSPTSVATHCLRIHRLWISQDAQLAAITAWGIPDASRLNRLAGITQPAFVANGDNDEMMHTENSGLLAERLPNARLRTVVTVVTVVTVSGGSLGTLSGSVHGLGVAYVRLRGSRRMEFDFWHPSPATDEEAI
jgi:pimeloyl-ACP methyl ester carboxylesterase